jgi:O-antigen/teichoic acid export membrane protein
MSLAEPKTIGAVAATEPTALPWVRAMRFLGKPGKHSLLLSGSMVMLIGSAAVSLFNFAYNVSVARLLGPEGFGHASAAVTLLMLISAVTLSFQLVCAKFVARNSAVPAQAAVYQLLRRRAWMVGLLMAGALALGSPAVAGYLRLPTPAIVILLAVGIAFYPALGAKRGALQGTFAFGKLAGNMVLETAAKFIVAVLLVAAGYGVMGAVGAITVSIVLSFLIPPLGNLRCEGELAEPVSFGEGMQAIVFFVGQVVINNIDILLVKHFFSPQAAGVYAAVALVGRVLYFASWSVVSAMFPISADPRRTDDSPAVLLVPLLLVLGISVIFILLMSYFPGPIVELVFGPGFHQAEPLLSLNAAATGCYALSMVLMAYEMARRISSTGWYQLAFSGARVAGVYLFHETLRQVLVVQVVLMAGLFIVVSYVFFRGRPTPMQEAMA